MAEEVKYPIISANGDVTRLSPNVIVSRPPQERRADPGYIVRFVQPGRIVIGRRFPTRELAMAHGELVAERQEWIEPTAEALTTAVAPDVDRLTRVAG